MKLAVLFIALFAVNYVHSANLAEILASDPAFNIVGGLATIAGLVTALTEPTPLTVFAPTNASIALSLAPTGALFGANLTDPIVVGDVLKFHIIVGNATSGSLTLGKSYTTLLGKPVRISKDYNSAQLRVNNIPIVTPDVLASNGVAHVIQNTVDPGLLVPSKYAANGVAAASVAGLNTLLQIAGNYTDIVAALTNSSRYFTIFAPTDAAFAEISAVLPTLSAAQVKDVLLYHVVEAVVYSTELAPTQTVPTLLGSTVAVTKTGNNVAVRGGSNSADASVVIPDVIVDNGVVHVINKVLLPPQPTTVPAGTTVAPGGSTAAPGGSTAAPGGSTAAPGGSTAAPGGSTAAPGGSTAAPAQTTAAPSKSSGFTLAPVFLAMVAAFLAFF